MKSKKFFALIFAFVLVFSLALFATPAAFAEGAGFAVTKHPTPETVSAGSKVLFVSYPNVAQYEQYWVFEDGAGQRINAENLPNYYAGVKVEVEGTKLRVLNVAEEMTGLSVQAVFVREGVEVCSNYATLTVTPGVRTNSEPCASASVSTVCAVAITKQPIDETKLNCNRSETYFSVGGSNIARVEWFCKIGKSGTEMSVAEAVSQYGVSAEGYDTCKLTLYSNSAGWEGIDGWMWRAKLYDCSGNYTYSKWVTTMIGWCTPPQPSCQQPCLPCVPCTPCAPVCPQTPCQPVGCGTPVCGFGITEISSTTTTHCETVTDTTVSSHGYTFW